MNDYTIDTIEYRGYEIKLKPDHDPESPRVWDNLGRMYCMHGRYELGDKHNYKPEQFEGWGEFKEQLKKDYDIIAISPLFLYDHSGLRIKIGSFNCQLPQGHAQFDSGQVGYIFTTKPDIRKWWGKKRTTKKLIKKADKILKSEVEMYDKYLSGQVYGFVVEKQDLVSEDSCWGYYSQEDAMQEAKYHIDWCIKEYNKQKIEKTKQFIKSRAPIIYRG